MEFKIVLDGDTNVGKTTYIKRILKRDFESNYSPTPGVGIYPISFNTNIGRIKFNVWDCAGHDNCDDFTQCKSLKNGYYIRAAAAIIMLDNTITPHTVESGKAVVEKSGANIPIIMVANKMDLLGLDPPYCEEYIPHHASRISCKEDDFTVLQRPFLELAKILTNNQNIQFI